MATVHEQRRFTLVLPRSRAWEWWVWLVLWVGIHAVVAVEAARVTGWSVVEGVVGAAVFLVIALWRVEVVVDAVADRVTITRGLGLGRLGILRMLRLGPLPRASVREVELGRGWAIRRHVSEVHVLRVVAERPSGRPAKVVVLRAGDDLAGCETWGKTVAELLGVPLVTRLP